MCSETSGQVEEAVGAPEVDLPDAGSFSGEQLDAIRERGIVRTFKREVKERRHEHYVRPQTLTISVCDESEDEGMSWLHEVHLTASGDILDEVKRDLNELAVRWAHRYANELSRPLVAPG